MAQGHPKGLYVCFGAEMFERLCYYGMRGLLILYLTKALMQGDTRAIGIYGAYTALVYAAPVWGRKAGRHGSGLQTRGRFRRRGDGHR